MRGPLAERGSGLTAVRDISVGDEQSMATARERSFMMERCPRSPQWDHWDDRRVTRGRVPERR